MFDEIYVRKSKLMFWFFMKVKINYVLIVNVIVGLFEFEI